MIVKYKLKNGITCIFNKIEEKSEMVILEGKTANNANKLLQMHGVEPDDLTKKQIQEHLKLLKDEQINDEYNAYLNNLYQRFAQTLSCFIHCILFVCTL